MEWQCVITSNRADLIHAKFNGAELTACGGPLDDNHLTIGGPGMALPMSRPIGGIGLVRCTDCFGKVMPQA